MVARWHPGTSIAPVFLLALCGCVELGLISDVSCGPFINVRSDRSKQCKPPLFQPREGYCSYLFQPEGTRQSGASQPFTLYMVNPDGSKAATTRNVYRQFGYDRVDVVAEGQEVVAHIRLNDDMHCYLENLGEDCGSVTECYEITLELPTCIDQTMHFVTPNGGDIRWIESRVDRARMGCRLPSEDQ